MVDAHGDHEPVREQGDIGVLVVARRIRNDRRVDLGFVQPLEGFAGVADPHLDTEIGMVFA